MSFSGFSDVEINQYERRNIKNKKPSSSGSKTSSSSSDPRRSIKHVPLKDEESLEELDLKDEHEEEEEETTPGEVEIENKEVPSEEPDLLGSSNIENEELRSLPVPLAVSSLSSPQDIEDENKRLKALIENAVKQRKERSVQEAEKLKQIQVELAKLDEIVGNDVKIIRKDIEAVTQQLSESRKRYDRLEKEFVSAKCELHRHEERKNNLTDYLCFIITENETRKSEKLHQLMKELNF